MDGFVLTQSKYVKIALFNPDFRAFYAVPCNKSLLEIC